MERIAVDDTVTLRVERRGDAEAVSFLLVHGLASNLRLWDGVAQRLADLGYSVVAVDQRGHGRSDKPDHGYDLATVSEDLAQVVDALALDRPVLVGQSWGGNVVLEAAWRFSELVRGVACIDGGWIELAHRFADWPTCLQAMTPPDTAGRQASEIETWLRSAHPDWSEPAIAGALACFDHHDDGSVSPRLSLAHHLAVLAGMWEHSPSSRYAEVDVPVLLVPAGSGSHDAQTQARGSRAEIEAAAGALPHGRLRWMAGDHDLHAQQPAGVAALLHETIADGFWT